ncbi:MAG TPA: putative hydro-lyase [Pseudolabrys sp.]|nr:putative hydro-lyase [Pseudolabrys sp.]
MSVTPLRNVVTWDRTDPRAARRAIRTGNYTGYTAAVAPGYVQANICILPRDWANDFLLFCQRNPKPCPLIARSNVGDPRLPSLADDLDIRTDVPRYHVFREGEFAEEVTDISSYWRDDLVTFALGCSFSFEEAMLEAGLRLKFLERNSVAGVYVTNVDTLEAGRFHGPLLVTMRAFKPADAIRAIQITSRFPNVHGAPVHIGDPAAIGVDLSKRYQDVGDGEVGQGEIPVFWACGLTPQLAVKNAKPLLCITHAPSSMLITDLRNASLAVL